MSDWDGVERRTFHRWRWLALLVWCILFTLITFLSLFYLNELRANDRKHINDNTFLLAEIQRSRLESCEQTYRTLQALLGTIYLNRPDLKDVSRKRFGLALRIADPAKCKEQVKVTGGP